MPESSIIAKCKEMNGMVKLGSGGTDVFCETMETPLKDCALGLEEFTGDTYSNAMKICQKDLVRSAKFGDKLAEIAHTAIEAARDEDGGGLAKWAIATIVSVSAVAVAAVAAVAAVVICKKKKSKESSNMHDKNRDMNIIGADNQNVKSKATGMTYRSLNEEVRGRKATKALQKTDNGKSSGKGGNQK